MFGVEDDLFAAGAEIAHALAYHGEILLGSDSEHLFRLRAAGFAEYADPLRPRSYERGEPRVVFGRGILSARGSERHETGSGQLREKFGVFGI